MKKMLFIFGIISACVLGFGNVAKAAPAITENKDIEINSPADIKGTYYEMGAGGVEVWTEEATFADEQLAKVVFDGLLAFYGTGYPRSDTGVSNNVTSQNPLSFTDTNMRAILAGFRGHIDAENKGINSIKGIQFLTHATTVNLKSNQIKDFTELNVSNTNYQNDHYGYAIGQDPDNLTEARNVTWQLGGNPFTILPYRLGGRLVIEAPQTVSSQYPDAEQAEFKFKRTDVDTFSGELPIDKCKIMVVDAQGNPTGDYRNVKVVTTNFVNRISADGEVEISSSGIKLDTSKGNPKIDANGNPTGEFLGYTNEMLYFKDLQTSRHQRIGIGLDQEIHYDTTDEYGTITQGSQSFKYYVDPRFYVYDSVKVASSAKQGIQLTKIDEESKKALGGTEYSLYFEEKIVQTNLKTGADGRLKIDNLKEGSYYLKETKAPTGYVLKSEHIPFEIPPTGTVKISGGTTAFTDSKGQAYTAAKNEVFVAGALDGAINLTVEGTTVVPQSVSVTYRKLITQKEDKVANIPEITEENLVRTFPTLAEAQTDINQSKQDSKLLGGIHVNVEFGTTSMELTQTNKKEADPPKTPPIDNPADTPKDPAKGNDKNPKTGDQPAMFLWLGILGLAGICICRAKKV